MVLKGSQDSPKVQGVNLLPTRTNYFIGRSREQWHTGVRSYGRVRYCDVYRGVDLVYHQSREQLEYDFVVSPNTSPSTIRLGFDGAESFRLDEDGNLVLKSRKGEIRHRKPTIYQNRDGQRRIIAGGYRLLRSGEVSFHVAPYDRTRPLIIDPVVTYSTFLTRDDGFAWVHDIAADRDGHAYVTGATPSLHTWNAQQRYATDETMPFVTKLKPDVLNLSIPHTWVTKEKDFPSRLTRKEMLTSPAKLIGILP